MKRPTLGEPALPARVKELIEEARRAEREVRREDARQRYEEALRLLADPAHAATASALLRWIGRTHAESGDGDAALDCYQAALAVADRVGARSAAASAMNCQAVVHFFRGSLDEAQSLYRQALRLAHAAGERELVAMVEQNLGNVANVRGDLERALSHFRTSLETYRALGLSGYLVGLLNNLGRLHTDLEQWDEAEGAFDEAVEKLRASGELAYQVVVEVNRARMWLARGRFAEARHACDEAYELTRRVNDDRWLGEVFLHYGKIFRHLGRYGLAEEHLERARETAEAKQETFLCAEVAREMAEVCRAESRNQETLERLNEAHRLFTALRARRELADVDQRLASLEADFLEIVREWGASIESKDRYTQGHCVRVAEYACALGGRVGLEERNVVWFRMGALLHDVGKVTIPREILNKDGALTDEEWEIMKSHPQAGVDLLGDIEFPWDVRPMILHHHERWDGTGYPHGLAGEDIPIAARVLCVADVFDALTSDRSYRGAHSVPSALAILREEAGRTFDPHLVEAFLALVDEGAFPFLVPEAADAAVIPPWAAGAARGPSAA